MKRWRGMLTIFLALAVMVGGVITAWAHGQPPVAGTAPICHGAYLETIVVDAQGQPVSHLQLCPDYYKAFAATGDIGAPQPLPRPERVRFEPWREQAQFSLPARPRCHNAARAPPLSRV